MTGHGTLLLTLGPRTPFWGMMGRVGIQIVRQYKVQRTSKHNQVGYPTVLTEPLRDSSAEVEKVNA